MKKIVGLLACLLLFSQNVFAASTSVVINQRARKVNPVKVEVNGDRLKTEFIPFAYQGRTLVPIREITESMGANVAWNNKNRTAQISLGGNKVMLQIGSKVVYINGKKKMMDTNSIPQFATYPRAKETKTMVPLRFLSEALDFDVNWNQKQQLATISNMKAVSIIDQKKPEATEKNKPATRSNQVKESPEKEQAKENEKTRKIEKKVQAQGPVTVIIDPGHGGTDSGAVSSVDPSVKEKDLALEVSRRLSPMLRAKNYEVIETRTGDNYPTLSKRAEIANKSQAEIFVSIHFNSSNNGMASGIEVLYAPEDKVKLKEHEQIHLAKALHEELEKATGSKMRSIKKRPDLAVLKWTEMPAALCELGFLSSPEDMELICQDDYLNRLATGICNGIEKYVNNYVVTQ